MNYLDFPRIGKLLVNNKEIKKKKKYVYRQVQRVRMNKPHPLK